MTTPRRTFLRQFGAGLAGLGLVAAWPDSLLAGPAKTAGLPRSTPEAQGLSSARIRAFVEAVEQKKLGLHSLMIVRHGQVVAEGWWDPYRPDLKHVMFSLSKSFTSTAIGFAVTEGKLKVSDQVVSFFPDDKPATVSDNLAAMRIKDLLTMSTGHEKDTLQPLLQAKEGGWAKIFLAQPVQREPGTHFVYNTGATYMLSAILRKVTGQDLISYLTPRLFRPLGIEGADWEVDPDGIATGGFGLRIRTEDIAKFGQLYLQKGVWNGKQLLPAAWVEEATSYQVANAPKGYTGPAHDWNQGYGYQFWRCRHNAYRGDGAAGQFCVVMPEQDAVIAMTSESHDLQGILNQVWEILLPAMQAKPLPADASAQAALKQKLGSLTLLPAKVAATSPVLEGLNGKTFALGDNALKAQAVAFAFNGNRCTFTLRDAQGEHRIVCGLSGWVKGETDMPGSHPKLVQLKNKHDNDKALVAAFGTWTDPTTFVMHWSFYETPHGSVVTCRFEPGGLRLEIQSMMAVKTGRTDKTVLEGKPVG